MTALPRTFFSHPPATYNHSHSKSFRLKHMPRKSWVRQKIQQKKHRNNAGLWRPTTGSEILTNFLAASQWGSQPDFVFSCHVRRMCQSVLFVRLLLFPIQKCWGGRKGGIWCLLFKIGFDFICFPNTRKFFIVSVLIEIERKTICSGFQIILK